jgi:glycosyltransferase involved in cell wall biosynthesis
VAIERAQCGVVAGVGDHAAVADALNVLNADRERLRRLGESGRAAYTAEYAAETALARYSALVS